MTLYEQPEVIDVPTKPWYTSKILWVNAVGIILQILGSPQVTDFVDDYPTFLLITNMVQGSLTIWLRSMAQSQPLAFKAATKSLPLKLSK